MMSWKIFASGVLASAALTLASYGAEAAGDPERGAKLYKECEGCHAPQKVLMGPPHCGVYGRKAGTVEGFPYSQVMQDAGFVWDEQRLDEFITQPFVYLSGTNMGYAGMYDEADRADVIAFLKEERAPDSPACKTEE